MQPLTQIVPKSDSSQNGYEISPTSALLFDPFLLQGAVNALDGSVPFSIHDPTQVWLVLSGRVDVFIILKDQEKSQGPRRYLASFYPGEAMFGFPFESEEGISYEILAVAINQTSVCQLPAIRFWRPLLEEGLENTVSLAVQSFIIALSRGIGEQDAAQMDLLIRREVEFHLPLEVKAGPHTAPVWIKAISGEACVSGLIDFKRSPRSAYFPMGAGIWIQSTGGESWFTVRSFAEVANPSELRSGIAQFQAFALQWVRHHVELVEIEQECLLETRRALENKTLHLSLKSLALLTSPAEAPPLAVSGYDPLINALTLIGGVSGISFQTPRATLGERDHQEVIREVCLLSGIGYRNVKLSGTWWKSNNGPFFAVLEKSQTPVALLPDRTGYSLHNPSTGKTRPIDSELMKQLSPQFLQFYRPLPNRLLKLMDLVHFGTWGSRKDLKTLLQIIGVEAVMTLVTPFLTGIAFSQVIPRADYGALYQVMIGFVVASISILSFDLCQALIILRLQSRSQVTLQAALCDRLLKLPLSFFQKYSVGSLWLRVSSLETIRQKLNNSVVTSLFSAVVAFSTIFFMLVCSPWLAAMALTILLGAVLLVSTIGYLSLKYQRRAHALNAEQTGFLFEAVKGISKIRVAAAEVRFFALWSEIFHKKIQQEYRARNLSNVLGVYTVALPVLSFALVCWVVGHIGSVSTAEFIAFNVAFSQFIAATVSLGTILIECLEVVPQVEGLKPIIETLPEVEDRKPPAHELSGKLTLNHIHFRYLKDGPLILNDVSLQVNPGEFVAFVGASGSGKSTILRLLLGFEKPEIGSVYYGEYELSQVDIATVRWQIGVVMQYSRLASGSIFTNIAGARLITLDQAWEAARFAGIEKEIQGLPMGMFTVLNEEGTVFSGGQRQRLLIARAIVNRPRILFFDEATNALDNETQKQVSESIDKLRATRLVIAHRLSTVKNAHRIIALNEGRIVEEGTYDELMARKGYFSELAARQMD